MCEGALADAEEGGVLVVISCYTNGDDNVLETIYQELWVYV